MATKTWKLGEVARGGIITVETTKDKVIVITKQWDFAAGTRRGSNQSQAQELYRKEVGINDSSAKNVLYFYLANETTSYHADKIVDWIETKVKLKSEFGY